MIVTVKDYWKSHISSVIYGYCVCGREVQHSTKKLTRSVHYAEQLLSGIYQIRNYGITERRTKQYDT